MTLCPGQEFVRSWRIEAITYQLERVRRGEIKRLIINMIVNTPPRSLKLGRLLGMRPRAIRRAGSSASAIPGSSPKSIPMTSAPGGLFAKSPRALAQAYSRPSTVFVDELNASRILKRDGWRDHSLPSKRSDFLSIPRGEWLSPRARTPVRDLRQSSESEHDPLESDCS